VYNCRIQKDFFLGGITPRVNIRKYFYTIVAVLLFILALSVFISAKFNISNIITNPYDFIDGYLRLWAPALSAVGTLFIAILAIIILYQVRRSQEREKEYAIRALHDEVSINLSNILPLRFRIEQSLEGLSDPVDEKLSMEDRKALFEYIDSEVFENLKNSGQLHFIRDLRMEIISCYKFIREYNRDQYFKFNHPKLLAKIQKQLESVLKNLEANYSFLPANKESKSRKAKSSAKLTP
jgi:hypothetical protein